MGETTVVLCKFGCGWISLLLLRGGAFLCARRPGLTKGRRIGRALVILRFGTRPSGVWTATVVACMRVSKVAVLFFADSVVELEGPASVSLEESFIEVRAF